MNDGRAVVVGASVAGLLAARALRERYADVVVLDRDVLPSGVRARRGVPQGRHAHLVPAPGLAAIDALVGGVTGDLVAAGAVAGELRWFTAGRETPARDDVGLLCSRPLFERTLRRRVEMVPGLRIAGSSEVTGLLTDAGRTRVTGVTIASGGRMHAVEDVDLVVDAAGRASRTPAWLTALGYDPAPEEVTGHGVTYVSQRYRGTPDQQGVVCVPGGAAIAQEGGTFLVTTAGPAVPALAEFARTGTPIGGPARLHVPHLYRRRYERATLPANLLVVGDALRTYDPAHGRGISAAARQATMLTDGVGQFFRGDLVPA